MFIPSAKATRRVIRFYLSGTRGGPVRFQIIKMLESKPCNTNMIATHLKIDYKTAQYHMKTLEKQGLIVSVKKKYDNTYRLSELLKANKEVLTELESYMGKT